MPSTSLPAVAALARGLSERGLGGAQVAIVLGSGLGRAAEAVADARRLPFSELPAMSACGAAGHAGEFVRGRWAGVEVLLQCGRPHLHEGRSPREVVRGLRAFAECGVRAVVLTNSAGGLRRDWPAGTWMRIRDHLNLQGASALEAGEGGYGTAFDASLGDAFDQAARAAGLRLERGVYAGMAGPAYESAAEIRMLERLGADAVGMSTVLEAQAARAAGLRVVALSLITNPAAGLAPAPLRHEDVLAAAQAANGYLERLLLEALPRVAAGLRAS